MIPSISITSAPNYNSLKQTFNEYTEINPEYKIKEYNHKNKK